MVIYGNMCMFQKHAQWSQAGEVAKRLKPRLPAPPMAGTWTQILRLTCVSQRAVPICQSYFVLYNSFTSLREVAGCGRSFDRRGTESHASRPAQIRVQFFGNECEKFFCFFWFHFQNLPQLLRNLSFAWKSAQLFGFQSWHLSDFSAETNRRIVFQRRFFNGFWTT